MNLMGIKLSGASEDPFAADGLLMNDFGFTWGVCELKNDSESVVVKDEDVADQSTRGDVGNQPKVLMVDADSPLLVLKPHILMSDDIFERFKRVLPDFLSAHTRRSPLPRARWKDLCASEPASISALHEMLAKLVEQAFWTVSATLFSATFESTNGRRSGRTTTSVNPVMLEPWMEVEKQKGMSPRKGKELMRSRAARRDQKSLQRAYSSCAVVLKSCKADSGESNGSARSRSSTPTLPTEVCAFNPTLDHSCTTFELGQLSAPHPFDANSAAFDQTRVVTAAAPLAAKFFEGSTDVAAIDSHSLQLNLKLCEAALTDEDLFVENCIPVSAIGDNDGTSVEAGNSISENCGSVDDEPIGLGTINMKILEDLALPDDERFSGRFRRKSTPGHPTWQPPQLVCYIWNQTSQMSFDACDDTESHSPSWSNIVSPQSVSTWTPSASRSRGYWETPHEYIGATGVSSAVVRNTFIDIEEGSSLASPRLLTP